MRPVRSSTTGELAEAVPTFLFHEANLLDERRYADWLALFSSDAHYWMPCDKDAPDRAFSSSLIDDNRAALSLRVLRLQQPNAHAMQPLPHSCRLISNVTIESETPLLVRSKLIVHEFQRREYARDDHRVFAATVHHKLRIHSSGFQIESKRVDLIDAGGARTLMPVPL